MERYIEEYTRQTVVEEEEVEKGLSRGTGREEMNFHIPLELNAFKLARGVPLQKTWKKKKRRKDVKNVKPGSA